MGIIVFISYAMNDSKRLSIPQIANALKYMKSIDKVHYWEGWNGFPNGDIIEFMEKGITECDVFIPVFTDASLNSSNCQKERNMAIFENKRIIPLFESFNLVPLACKTYLGLCLTQKSVNDIESELYKIIISQATNQQSVKTQTIREMEEKVKGFEKMIQPHERQNINIEDEVKKQFDKKKKEAEDIKKLTGKLAEYEVRKKELDQKKEADAKHEETIDFRGAQISKFEANILQEIESLTKLEFTKVKIINYNTKMGFNVKNNKIIGIGLYQCGLTTLPESIGQLYSLQTLDLSSNQLLTLPEFLGQLSSLIELRLYDNKLTTLPESLGNLTSLQILYLFNNQLNTLSESLGNLKSLQTLELKMNKLTTLPESIGQLSSLQTLDLSSNQLSTLPDSITQLKSLRWLRLSDNQLMTLPESLGQLSSIIELRLYDNKLTNLPISIGQLYSLQELDVRKNKLTPITESIKKLKKRGVRILL